MLLPNLFRNLFNASALASLTCLGFACQGALDADFSGQLAPSPQATGASAAGEGATATDAPGDQVLQPAPGVEVVDTRLYRLTRSQYARSVQALTGVDIDPERLPQDVTPRGFSNVGGSQVSTSLNGVGQYDNVARQVASELFSNAGAATAFVGCDPQTADESCIQAFLSNKLDQAFRRAATPEEVARYQLVVDRVSTQLGGTPSGLEFATATMLQSPYFVYRIEVSVPDASSPAAARYDDYTLASRLSYLLTDGPPDATLIALAGAAQLAAPETLIEQAGRLLNEDAAGEALQRYFEEWLGLRELDGLTKDYEAFPNFSVEVSAAMREELRLSFRDIAFDEARDYSELLTTRRTFLNELLSQYYEVPLDQTEPAPSNPDFFAVELPPSSRRAGLLGRGGIQAINARSTMTSPTLRGIFIREQLLCQAIPTPPEGVDTEIPEAEGVETQRQRLERHRTDPVCAGCHAFVDPLGLALENFDASGAYRTTEYDLPIDTSGEMDGVSFNGPEELGQALRNHPESTKCLTRKFTEHGLGREVSVETVQEVAAAFETSGRSFLGLIRALVSSPAFRYPLK